MDYLEQEKQVLRNEIRANIETKVAAYLLEHPDRSLYALVNDLTEFFPIICKEDPAVSRMHVEEIRRFAFQILNMTN